MPTKNLSISMLIQDLHFWKNSSKNQKLIAILSCISPEIAQKHAFGEGIERVCLFPK